MAALLYIGCMAGSRAEAAEKPAPSDGGTHSLPVFPKATITEATIGKDGHSLLFEYLISNATSRVTVNITNHVDDFRYCAWNPWGPGVAFVISTLVGETNEFHYGVVHLTGKTVVGLTLAKIPERPGKNHIWGISTTGGDSIIISAIQHIRNADGERVEGWVFADNCPNVTADGKVLGISRFVPFVNSTNRLSSAGSSPQPSTTSNLIQPADRLINVPTK